MNTNRLHKIKQYWNNCNKVMIDDITIDINIPRSYDISIFHKILLLNNLDLLLSVVLLNNN